MFGGVVCERGSGGAFQAAEATVLAGLHKITLAELGADDVLRYRAGDAECDVCFR